MSVQLRLYARLLRSCQGLQSDFESLGGSRDMRELDRLVVRAALRKEQKVDTKREVLSDLKNALQTEGGLVGYVKKSFRSEENDEMKAFEALRLGKDLTKLIEKCKTEVPRPQHLDLNIGTIVYHNKLDVLGVVYAFSHVYHIACLDGCYRKALPADLEPQKSASTSFVDAVPPSAQYFIHTWFPSMTAHRLIPNPDLWLRYPDCDGATATSFSTIPLKPVESLLEESLLGPPLQGKQRNGKEKPTLLSIISSLFYEGREKTT
eukprot:TRINITY_DN7644_c0_g1_i1.p1 TRINITY_DN7644_c0_g1~~TRINITY_DN7644_c0_g1_i1.p1  ORF type:complete len:263 (+),score=33.79 TRINITY_DN7644_c0_g1_i1:72-860(+)